jgi:hypothetical protein
MRKLDARSKCTACISLAPLHVTSGSEAHARKTICCGSQNGQWFEYLRPPSTDIEAVYEYMALADNKDLELRKIQILN